MASRDASFEDCQQKVNDLVANLPETIHSKKCTEASHLFDSHGPFTRISAEAVHLNGKPARVLSGLAQKVVQHWREEHLQVKSHLPNKELKALFGDSYSKTYYEFTDPLVWEQNWVFSRPLPRGRS